MKLTTEQVRETIERHFGRVAVLDDGKPVEWREGWVCNVGFNFRAIADELNAALGDVTCKVESMHGYTDAHTHTSWCVELSCHTLDAWEDSIPPSYCPICGRKVVDDG